jgi:hypothetical protein
MGEMMWKPEDKERNERQLASNLCWDCFEQLESREIAGLELFDLYFYLRKKARRYQEGRVLRTYKDGGMWHDVRYSGMCHDYRWDVRDSSGKVTERGNWESGYTAEQDELHKIASEVNAAYENEIQRQRTPKRIELDEYQKTAGFVMFGSQPRPEGFVGDSPGKQRFEVLFGIDLGAGKFVAPTIQLSKSSKTDGEG